MEDKEYIMIDPKTPIIRNGLNDVRDRFLDFLRISKFFKLKPIMPEVYLRDYHSEKKNCLLKDYIELPDNILVNDINNIDISKVFVWTLTDRWLSHDKFFKSIEKSTNRKIYAEKYYTYLPYKEKFNNIAKNIISKMKRPICTLKVRRDDMLNIHPKLNAETSPENIYFILKKTEKKINTNFNTIYIMTDVKDINFFEDLRDTYNIKQYFDFNELKKNKFDNYSLFCIETYIRDLSDYRISMFKTNNNAKLDGNFIPNYYCASLSSIGGNQ